MLLFNIDTLLGYTNSIAGGNTKRAFTIGQVFSIGANPTIAYLETQLESVTITSSGANRAIIDTTNSDSRLTNMFRYYSFSSQDGTRHGIQSYNIARFEYHSTALPQATGSTISAGNIQYAHLANQSLGIPIGLTSTASVPDSSPPFYFGVSNIRNSSAEHNATLIQDTSVTTHVDGIKYPNNGYSTSLSSSNITDIFDLKELTQAEMRILTNKPTGSFSSTGNMVLEAKISGAMTVQKATTAETVTTTFSIRAWTPTYTNGTITAVTLTPLEGRAPLTSDATVTTITADADGLWPVPYSITEGDLFVITGGTTGALVGTASALAINFVQV